MTSSRTHHHLPVIHHPRALFRLIGRKRAMILASFVNLISDFSPIVATFVNKYVVWRMKSSPAHIVVRVDTLTCPRFDVAASPQYFLAVSCPDWPWASCVWPVRQSLAKLSNSESSHTCISTPHLWQPHTHDHTHMILHL